MKEGTSFVDASLVMHVLVASALLVNVGLLFFYGGSNASGSQTTVTFITTPECDNCFDLNPFKQYLVESGLGEEQMKWVDHASFVGKRLVKKYQITQLPNVVIEGNISDAYLQDLIQNEAAKLQNNALILDWIHPPYLDLEQGKVRGDFEVVYLTDAACETCYDVKQNSVVFERLVMTPSKEQTLDVASEEGRLLLEEYFITGVPTILLRGDLEPYQEFNQIWPQVGTVEEDGTYVLRQGVSSMGIYKTIPDGEIIDPSLSEGV